jgi:hypothetical protein
MYVRVYVCMYACRHTSFLGGAAQVESALGECAVLVPGPSGAARRAAWRWITLSPAQVRWEGGWWWGGRAAVHLGLN